MNKISLLVAVMMIIAKTPAYGSSPNCGELVEELKAMRAAQQSLLLALAKNHEDFASSMEELSADLAHTKKTPPKALKTMNKTAQAYRTRGITAKRQAASLDQATLQLTEDIESCLK